MKMQFTDKTKPQVWDWISEYKTGVICSRENGVSCISFPSDNRIQKAYAGDVIELCGSEFQIKRKKEQL